MTLEGYRTLFLVGGLILGLVALIPGLSVVFSFPEGERFSELWLLGSEHMAEGYPFNVRAGEMQGPVYVGICNHMGDSQYYVVQVKFRNWTQLLPNGTMTLASPLPTLHEFGFFLADGETKEVQMGFAIVDAAFEGNVSVVAKILINNHSFPVDLSSRWNVEKQGFYYQLFFELWRYDSMMQSLRFHNRFVTLWLNMTRT